MKRKILIVLVSITSYLSSAKLLDVKDMPRCIGSEPISIPINLRGYFIFPSAKNGYEDAFMIGAYGVEKLNIEAASRYETPESTLRQLVEDGFCIKESMVDSGATYKFIIQKTRAGVLTARSSESIYLRLNSSKSRYETKTNSFAGALLLSALPLGGGVSIGMWQKLFLVK